MNSIKTPRIIAAFLALLILTVPMHADRRRAVKHGASMSAYITGTVVDNVTGQPVRSATVTLGTKTDTTSSTGKYSLWNATVTSTSVIQVSRTGYATKSVPFTTGGEHVVDFRLDPLPTVSVRTSDGVTRQLDFESIQFGYVVPFSGYISSESEDFCKSDGTTVSVNRSEIKRITGPAVAVQNSGCCPNNEILRVALELKSGTTETVYFADSCAGYTIDLIGRNHVTGQFEYLRFPNIEEIVFP
jgi:hypothetical protein